MIVQKAVIHLTKRARGPGENDGFFTCGGLYETPESPGEKCEIITNLRLTFHNDPWTAGGAAAVPLLISCYKRINIIPEMQVKPSNQHGCIRRRKIGS